MALPLKRDQLEKNMAYPHVQLEGIQQNKTKS